MDWTDEEMAELQRLWQAGSSGTTIAQLMGKSRNAVLGKLHRLKAAGKVIQKRNKQGDRPRKKRVRKVRYVSRVRIAPTPLAPPEPPKDIKGITIWKLTERTCRWPLNDGWPWLFCGKKEADMPANTPYCRWHTQIAQFGTPIDE